MRNRSERNKTGLKKTKETNVYTKKPKPFVRKTKPNAIKAGEGDEDPDVS
ncbi:MAG: hypothetical protein RIS47_1597, partial [Bacteroidota bacterium]